MAQQGTPRQSGNPLAAGYNPFYEPAKQVPDHRNPKPDTKDKGGDKK